MTEDICVITVHTRDGESERKNKDDERKKRHGNEMEKRKRICEKVMETINDKNALLRREKQFSHSNSIVRNEQNIV